MTGYDPSTNINAMMSQSQAAAAGDQLAMASIEEKREEKTIVDRFGPAAAIAGILKKIFRLVYRRENFHILVFDLNKRKIPSPNPEGNIRICLLTPSDALKFAELWAHKRAVKMARFRQRIKNGHVGIGAWNQDGNLVGVNWITDYGEYDSLTGLFIGLAPGSCYALDLQEHKDYAGRRIGLSILTYSILEAKRRGYNYHFIGVSSENKKMLAGARYLLGYKIVGEIKTTYWFRRPRSTWKVGDKRGKGGTLLLGE